MVQVELDAGAWRVMGLLGNTIKSSRNIDESSSVAGHQDRSLWGVEVEYTGLSRHRPFVYLLDNRDHTESKPRDHLQAYEYDSTYIGIGSRGSVLLPHLRYQAELVGEFGKTYSEGVTSGQDRICAMALDVLLEYLFQVPTHPKVTLEYIYGSGDEDRRATSSATIGGNSAGTTDHAFNGFGFRDTGLAFAPRISNLHVYSIGSGFLPLENHELFRKLEVGTKVLFYQRAVESGPISDTTATKPGRWVGWEWDVYCDWRISSDLTWTIRYGAFQPGDAFEDDTCRQFLYSGIIYSF